MPKASVKPLAKENPSSVKEGKNTRAGGTSARGLKARAKLKAAALSVMEEMGYHRMRIVDVTGRAGVASGLFYHYFKDLKTLAEEVLKDFVAYSLRLEDIEKDVPKGDWYQRIVAHNRVVVRAYAEQPGIMRCLLQLADEDETFAAFIRQNFIHQLSWLTKLMPRLFPAANMTEHQALVVIYSLAGTGEAILRDYYINREPALIEKTLTEDEMVELISVMFYRGLFLEHPPAQQLSYLPELKQMSFSACK